LIPKGSKKIDIDLRGKDYMIKVNDNDAMRMRKKRSCLSFLKCSHSKKKKRGYQN
jgi:hypothetical protein